jgi:hypothetical protein
MDLHPNLRELLEGAAEHRREHGVSLQIKSGRAGGDGPAYLDVEDDHTGNRGCVEPRIMGGFTLKVWPTRPDGSYALGADLVLDVPRWSGFDWYFIARMLLALDPTRLSDPQLRRGLPYVILGEAAQVWPRDEQDGVYFSAWRHGQAPDDTRAEPFRLIYYSEEAAPR